MPTRTAHTLWTGTLERGQGVVEVDSDSPDYVTVAGRLADDADGMAGPEEFLAASHSSCYAIHLAWMITQAGGTPTTLGVRVDITLGSDPEGGLRVVRSAITLRGGAEGLTDERFRELAEGARSDCVISKALGGRVEITLDVETGSVTV
ncbi:OsmC family peroxiredoxin [Dermatophilaceae bacterium Soc4.6]